MTIYNEDKNLRDFGYVTKFLTKGSNRKVWVICPYCKQERIIQYYLSVRSDGRCPKCAQKIRRGTLNGNR